MTHYENIKNMTIEQMAYTLTAMLRGAVDLDETEVHDAYTSILAFLASEVEI